MKTSTCFAVKMFFGILVFSFSYANDAMSQYLLKYPNNPTSYFDLNGRLGIGTTSPSALLHLKFNGAFQAEPMFKTELYNTLGTTLLGSVQHCVSVSGQNYGIYQISTQGGLMNYFQDPVKIGNMTLSKEGANNSKIATDQLVNNLAFVMNANYGVTTYPLTISGNGVRVRYSLVTDEFQMTNGAGQNKVLMSDAVGNARWDNPISLSLLPWLITENKDIVSNTDCHFVGIGTQEPQQMLEVCPSNPQGGISINQLSKETTGSEIVFKKNSEAQCAVGHYYNAERSSFLIFSHLEWKTEFYMDLSNGMTGIGTEWPCAKLDIAGDLRVQTKLGVGCIPPDDPNGLYNLYVEGGIKARDIKVTITDFPDYCFDDDYPLMSLTDLRKYINENKHLPGMPSIDEIKQNQGFEIGGLQTKLLEKVEEQALYILDLQNQIIELKNQVDRLINK